MPKPCPRSSTRSAARGLAFEGFHIYSGSQNLKAEAICEAQQKTFELALRLLGGGAVAGEGAQHRRRLRHPLLSRANAPLDLAPIGANLARPRRALQGPRCRSAHLVIELGRYLVGEAGIYVCRVVDRKISRGQVFLVTDGGLHHHLAASGNFGQVIRKNYPVVIGNRMRGARARNRVRGRTAVHAARSSRRPDGARGSAPRRSRRRVPVRRLWRDRQPAGVPEPPAAARRCCVERHRGRAPSARGARHDDRRASRRRRCARSRCRRTRWPAGSTCATSANRRAIERDCHGRRRPRHARRAGICARGHGQTRQPPPRRRPRLRRNRHAAIRRARRRRCSEAARCRRRMARCLSRPRAGHVRRGARRLVRRARRSRQPAGARRCRSLRRCARFVSARTAACSSFASRADEVPRCRRRRSIPRRSSTTSTTTSFRRRARSSGRLAPRCRAPPRRHCASRCHGGAPLAAAVRADGNALRGAQGGLPVRAHRRRVRPASGRIDRLLSERRNRQLDGRRHGHAGHRQAGEDVLDRLRRRGIRRDGVRAHRRRHFGTDHHEYYITPDDLVERIPRVAASFDQPFGNSSALPAYFCARLAHDDGVTRMLAGDGGDELFGGNSRYAPTSCSPPTSVCPASLKRSLIEPLALGLPLRAVPLLRKGARYVEIARMPVPGRMQLYNLLTRMGPASVFTPEFLAAGRRRANRTGASSRPMTRRHRPSTLNRMLAYDWKYILADNDLPKVTGTATLGGVDVGFPLLDDRLLDFSLGLPPELKVRGRKLRYFFKEALRGFLPDEIIAKKKHGFGLPFGVWLMRDPALRDFALASINALAARGIIQPYACPDALRRAHRRARRLLWRDDLDPDDARAVARPGSPPGEGGSSRRVASVRYHHETLDRHSGLQRGGQRFAVARAGERPLLKARRPTTKSSSSTMAAPTDRSQPQGDRGQGSAASRSSTSGATSARPPP